MLKAKNTRLGAPRMYLQDWKSSYIVEIGKYKW